MAAAIGSQLFSPFRALGYIANHVPLAVQSQGTENLVVTAVGSAFHVYNCAKLNLLFVGQLNDEEVSCLTTYKHFVITACGQEIKMWHRGKTVASFVGHDKDVHCLLTFGAHLISVDEGSSLKVWDIKTTELYLEVGFDSKTFHITCLMHPSTYLNKILLCSKQGSMQIWNIKTNKMIYSFEGWSCPITAVEQAPAIDVVAVGLQSGKIVIHNLKVDETVMTFQQDWGPVTAIAFRTDGNPVMATASPSGNIALWDLEGRKLRSTLIDAHDGSVCGLKFLPSQPLLATNGPDNALKLWIFDQPDGSGRLLRSRSGHSAPPTKIRFYGHKGSDILSAGLDRTFRHISTANDARSCELSQGSLAKKAKNSGIKVEELKLTPITDFAAETTRNSDWENIVTCHQGNKQARSWWFQKKALGKHTLETRGNKDGDNTSITAVTISSCGNFAIIGDSKGHVDSFNIQSGNHRASYGNPRAHKGCVRGVAIDGVNQQLLSAGADSQLRFWSFTKRKLLSKLSFEAPMTGLEIHRESSLAAVVCEDFSIHIADIEMHRIVRTFTGHANRITDVSFSPDGRWLISSSMDSTIRTWDLPAARLIDCFLVASPVTSLTLSPTGEYLTTSHVDDLGVYLWSNKTLYGHVALVPLPSTFEPSLVQLPVTSGGETEEMSDAILETRTSGEVTDMGETQESRMEEFKSPDQLSNELITMSLLPQSRWRNLTSLEIIKQRNRPKQPPKPPKSAPFFLPTEPGLVPKFVAEEKDVADEEVSQSKLIQLRRLQPQTEFQKMLDKCSSSGDCIFMVLQAFKKWTLCFEAMEMNLEDQNKDDPLMSSLKAMGPSAIDAELRLVSPESGGTIALMQQFMEFLSTHMATKRDFELVEAYMALFLKLHGSLIMEHPELVRAARQLQAQHEHTWTKLRDLINQGLCLVSYYKSALI